VAAGRERAMHRAVSGLLTPAGRSATATGEDLDLLHRDQPIVDHLVELGQDGTKAVGHFAERGRLPVWRRSVSTGRPTLLYEGARNARH
jgi:hypothetical protein